jgi:hypothetical protein
MPPHSPLRAWAGAFCLLAALFAPHPAAARTVTADQFADSIGVNIHAMYLDGGYRDLDQVIRCLRYLGVVHVRDAVPADGPRNRARYDKLAQAGIRFDFFVQKDIAGAVSRMHAFETRHPGAIAMIEGPNEVNNWPVTYGGRGGTAGALAFQAALYKAVRADPVLRGIPILNFTGLPDAAGPADFTNIHPYPHRGRQPYATLTKDATRRWKAMPGKPIVLTEAGYYTLPGKVGWGGVDDATQARLIVNLLLDAAYIGAKRTYLYQLLDAYPDPDDTKQESHFGLFDLHYRPKPAATAIRNLTELMASFHGTSTSASPAMVDFATLPGTVRSLTIQAGTTQLVALWNESELWDNDAARARMTDGGLPVIAKVEHPGTTVVLHRPLQGLPPQPLAVRDGAVTVDVGADAVILEVQPGRS